MRWLRSASLLRSILRLVFSYVAGASTSGSCAPPPTKKAKQAAEAAAVYEHLSTHAQHVPPLRVGRPPEELTAGSHSYRATGGKCPKCGWQANNFPKSSGAHAHTQTRTHARTHAHAHTHTRTYAHARAHAGVQHAHTHTFMHAGAYYYHYGSHGKFDNGKLEWCSPDGRSLCQKTDKALIDRLKEDARRGGRRINADATIFGVMSQSVRASGGLFTTTRGEGACLHFDSRIFMQLEYPQVRVLQVPMLHQR